MFSGVFFNSTDHIFRRNQKRKSVSWLQQHISCTWKGMCWFVNAKGIGTQTPMQYAQNSTTGVGLGWISLFSFRICSIEFNSRPRACHDLLSILFGSWRMGMNVAMLECVPGPMFWMMTGDVMIDLISYHDAWSVPRFSFNDRCISIAFTTPSSDLRWKCNIDFPVRR